jgi:GNAT superfamily N-acetyltransferase
VSTVAISRVRTRRERRRFIDLPFALYGRDPNWVAPLRSELRAKLDPVRGPFFSHGDAALFIAQRGESVVGRISAQVDHIYNEFHSTETQRDRTGFWGFFECDDDPDTSEALFDAAEGWLAEQGCVQMVGPASFTLNDEAGLLVEGFDAPPMVLMSYNPPLYERLVEKAGFSKAQDLYAYRLDANAEPPPDVVAFGAEAARDYTFRTLDRSRFADEMRRFLEVYNEAWERNWGFAPMTDQEIREHAKRLKPILDPRLVLVAERDGEPVAVGLTIPDVNEELIRARGRLGPVTAARLLRRARRGTWNSCRVVALGVKRGHRTSGIGAHLYVATLEAARRAGYRWGEMSWILESNDAMNRAIIHMGGERYKTYRMYARQVRS